mgnify:CR=1 FL=1|jgi:hypothetical protein
MNSLIQSYGSDEERTEGEEEEEEEEEAINNNPVVVAVGTEKDDNNSDNNRRRRRILSVPEESIIKSSLLLGINEEEEKEKDKEQCKPEIQQRVGKYLEAKRSNGMNINAQLREPKGFRNPLFLQSVFEHFQVNEKGSELFRKKQKKMSFDEEDYYDNIAKRQRQEAEDRFRNRNGIEFTKSAANMNEEDAQGLIEKAREQARILNARFGI